MFQMSFNSISDIKEQGEKRVVEFSGVPPCKRVVRSTMQPWSGAKGYSYFLTFADWKLSAHRLLATRQLHFILGWNGLSFLSRIFITPCLPSVKNKINNFINFFLQFTIQPWRLPYKCHHRSLMLSWTSILYWSECRYCSSGLTSFIQI